MHDKLDKLFQIRNVLNYVQHIFQIVCTPKQELSLYKSIIPW